MDTITLTDEAHLRAWRALCERGLEEAEQYKGDGEGDEEYLEGVAGWKATLASLPTPTRDDALGVIENLDGYLSGLNGSHHFTAEELRDIADAMDLLDELAERLNVSDGKPSTFK